MNPTSCIVVTGGAGFIGSATVWALNQRGIDNILVVDELGTDEKWQNLRGLSFADYIEKDRFRTMMTDNALAGAATAIIHLGACSSTTETDASYLLDNNFQYTKDVAEFAVRNKVRFIYASSAATYGDGSFGYDDDHDRLSDLRPLNMYGYSKQLFDLWARKNGYLASMAGLKFSNVFGPNEYHKKEMRSVAHRAYQQIKESGAVHLFKSYRDDYGDGEQQRDFVYVKDAVDMILFCVDNPAVTGIFNVGAGIARTWNDLARACFAALDMAPTITYIDMPAEIRDRYQYFTRLNMEKIRLAGFTKAPHTLEEAVRDYYLNYLVPGSYLE